MGEKRETQWVVSKLEKRVGIAIKKWVPRWWFDSREEALRYVHNKPRAYLYRIDPIKRGPRS